MGLLDGIQQALLNKGGEATNRYLNEHVTGEAAEFALEVGVDSIVNSIPGVGSAIATYKNKKEIKNLEILTRELESKIERFSNLSKEKSDADKETIDDILEKAVDTAINIDQETKIKFIVQGFESIIENEDISYDVASLYFGTLERISLLDIAVLKHYCTPFDLRDIQSILDNFNIDLDMFQSSRAYLRTLGLIETKSDIKVTDDIEMIYKSLDDTIKNVEIIKQYLLGRSKKFKPSRITKLKKLESKERYQSSKFGRNFYSYFIEER